MLTNFIGGSPATVALRLVVVSFVVGIVLATFGFEPMTLIDEAWRAVRHLILLGLSDFREFGRIFLTGAIVVVPVWLALRLLDAGRGR